MLNKLVKFNYLIMQLGKLHGQFIACQLTRRLLNYSYKNYNSANYSHRKTANFSLVLWFIFISGVDGV